MVLMGYTGARGTLIYGKIWSKISCQTSFNRCITTIKMHITSAHIYKNAHHIRSHPRKMHITSAHIQENAHQIPSHPQNCTSNPLTSTKVHITSLKCTFHILTSTKMHITSAHIHKNAHHILFTVESRLQKSTSHPQTWPHHACNCIVSA